MTSLTIIRAVGITKIFSLLLFVGMATAFWRIGELAARRQPVPDLVQIVLQVRLEVRQRLFIHPAVPALAFTALKPSYTSHLSMTNGFVVLIGFLLLPVEPRTRRPDPTPLLRPHYQPSSLVRIGPSQCFASVLSPRGFYHLRFSLHIGTTGSRSSAQEPGSASRPYTPVVACPVIRFPATRAIKATRRTCPTVWRGATTRTYLRELSIKLAQ
jgi:hypothetical protein